MKTEIRPLLALATPMVVSLLLGTMAGLLDTLMLGAMGGEQARDNLAAISLTYNALILGYCALYGMMSPVGIRVGQAVGAGKPESTALVFRAGIWLGLITSVAVTLLMLAVYWLVLPWLRQPMDIVALALPYWITVAIALIPYNLRFTFRQFFEAAHRPWLGTALVLVMIASKAVYNILLVPPLGLFGAGIATILAETTGLLLAIWCYRQYRQALVPIAAPVAPRALRQELKAQYRDGLPMAWQYFLEGGAMIVGSLFLGWLGATAMAANQIVMSVSTALYMLPLGIASAVSIRIAQAAGAGKQERLRASGLAGLVLVSGWMALFTVIYLLAGHAIARQFVTYDAVVQMAAGMFVVVGLMQMADGVQSVSLGALRGLLDVRWPARVSIVCYWLVALPLGYVLAFHTSMGASGVWAGFAVGIMLASVLLARRFWQKTAPLKYHRPAMA